MSAATKEALDRFIDVMDEVVFEPEVTVDDKLATMVVDRYVALRKALASDSLEALRACINADPELKRQVGI